MRISRLLVLLSCFLVVAQTGVSQDVTVAPGHLSRLHFRTIGPAAMSGRIVDLAVDEKDPYVIYVASATGGLFKTTNNGVTFEPIFEKESVHSIGAIAVHARQTEVVWVGTGERANRQSSSWGDGVFKSTDGGKTWSNMGLRDSHHIGRIALDPENPDVVYVAAMGHLWGPNEERGLYRSRDGGKTWERTLFIDQDTGVVDVAVDPQQPSVVYAASYQRRRTAFGFHGGGPGSALYKSTDGGGTWKKLAQGLPEGDWGRVGISIYRKDPRIVYVCVEQGWRYNASTAYGERRAGVYRSEDRGETWVFQGDWNPRPMYASQILVDPSDDQRIYMMNSFSYSDDGGKSFQRPRQSLHGDDRIVWVNPRDSRHLIKGDDGGVGISYDRGKTWLFVASLPVSQYYRVAVDGRDPYWVYGGLQDNGSWAGPSATFHSDGILNQDWVKTGGGDGFFNLIHPVEDKILYNASQYLGLQRFNLDTLESQPIRPGDPQGHIQARRNWDAWGPGLPEPELGNAMEPANWDAPFIFSPHDPNTLYAGTRRLWKSIDGGRTWEELADLTTGVNRRELSIMGQRPDDDTHSLDDGVPYYPTITALAESPLRPGLLYGGTDDGNLQVSLDGGRSWKEVSHLVPGLPDAVWVSGLEASSAFEGRIYAVFNNYRNDDFENYVFRSEDYGNSWAPVTSDLPGRRVARTLREDPRNPNLLFLGTEIGLFVSFDAGLHWVELKANMPTLAFNDLLIHPRDNDLVLGSHGRGIWILDEIGFLQQTTAEALQQDAHLFDPPDARMIRYNSAGGHVGDMIFRGENPPRGAVIDYFLKQAAEEGSVRLEILDAEGALVSELPAALQAGFSRSVWNLRYPNLPARPRAGSDDDDEGRPRGRGPAGPWVKPGIYRVRLTAAGTAQEKWFRVTDDPRLEVTHDVRRDWTDHLVRLAGMYREIAGQFGRVVDLPRQLDEAAQKYPLPQPAVDEAKELHRRLSELVSRIAGLYDDVSGWTGGITADQVSRGNYYAAKLQETAQRLDAFQQGGLSEINRVLPSTEQIKLGPAQGTE